MRRAARSSRDGGGKGAWTAGEVSRMWEHQHDSGVYPSKCAQSFGGGQRLATVLRPSFRARMLLMGSNRIQVRVFAAPDVSCGHGITWSAASAIVFEALKRRFGDAMTTEHIEMFSARSFDFPEVMAAIQAGSQLPLVMVGDRIVSRGGKLTGRIIREAVTALLASKNEIH